MVIRWDGFCPMQRNKPRSDSVLDNMPAASRGLLDSWFEDKNLSYAEVCDLVLTELEVATSPSALSRYYARWIVPRRHASAVLAAQACREGEAVEFDAVARQLAAQMLFESLVQPKPDLDRAQKLVRVFTPLEHARLGATRIALQERRVVVLEKKTAKEAENLTEQKGAERDKEREAAEAAARSGLRRDAAVGSKMGTAVEKSAEEMGGQALEQADTPQATAGAEQTGASDLGKAGKEEASAGVAGETPAHLGGESPSICRLLPGTAAFSDELRTPHAELRTSAE